MKIAHKQGQEHDHGSNVVRQNIEYFLTKGHGSMDRQTDKMTDNPNNSGPRREQSHAPEL